MKLTKAWLLVALCVFAQRVDADGHEDDDKCEEWIGDGGCHVDCKFPDKCCVQILPVCFDKCPFKEWCVHDPEWCVDKLVEQCKIVPKQVCSVKPVCEKVKQVVCKWVNEEKCEIVKEHVCKYIDECKKVPVKKCEKVCDWVTKCYDDDDDGGSVAYGSAYASGGDSASAGSTAYASSDGASATADASATGDNSVAATNTYASTDDDGYRRRLLDCKKVKVCDDKCKTVYETKCEKKKVCEEVPKKVCKKVPVKKCYDDWKEVCKNVKKCDWIDEKVCKLVKVTVCKDKYAECGPVVCKEWEKCNPECCPDTKVATCVKHH